MTAEEMRALSGADKDFEKRKKQIEENIRQSALIGRHSVSEQWTGGRVNGDKLTDYFEKQGFHVTHYISPWDELKIEW